MSTTSKSLLHESWRFALGVLATFIAIGMATLALMAVTLFAVLYHISPTAGLWMTVLCAIPALYGLLRLLGLMARYRTLATQPPRRRDEATFPTLKRDCKQLIGYMKRLGGNPYLDEPARLRILQAAYDLSEILDHHPIMADLEWGAEKAITQQIAPVHEQLRALASQLERENMKAVVENVTSSPFPGVNALIVGYCQIRVISHILQIYVAQPSIPEFVMIVRDVWRVIQRGNFFRLGQSLFQGVYVNSPPLGSAVDDLGQALTSIWMMRTVSQTAMLRCESMGYWDTDLAVQELESHTLDSLLATKESLIHDAMPLIKLRIRHSAPHGTTDAAGFSTSIAEGLVKAIDTLISSVRQQTSGATVAQARKTMPGLSMPQPGSASTQSGGEHHGPPAARTGFLGSFRQRIKYAIRGPPK